MVYHIIRWWATIFLRLYFRKIIVHGLENLPRKGPLIVASNHPSAFMEASILATVLKRPLHFLVRGDMFHPRFRWLFNWTNQIPIYRKKDGISNLRKNASSFDLTYRKLAEGNAVLIFPEAKTLLEKKMRPLQRGTAHLAFGTLPFLKQDQKLIVLPVGVNFTEPRIPGTDVVVRIGLPFETLQGRREDREAIEQFTNTLIDAMDPLIIQVDEMENEKLYEVLASVYLRFIGRRFNASATHENLVAISDFINTHEKNHPEMVKILDYRMALDKIGIRDAVYFPHVITMPRFVLFLLTVYKCLWLVAGGWIWRLTRSIIFSKIKTNTFQSPTSLGIAMVVYPFIFLLLLMVFAIAGWPLWYVPAWIVFMGMGILVRPHIGLMWKVLSLSGESRAGLKKKIRACKAIVESLIS